MDKPHKFRCFIEAEGPAPAEGGQPSETVGRGPEVIAWLRELSPHHLLIIKHEADSDDARPHWHALLFFAKQTNTVRQAFVRAFPEYKGQYSLQEMPDSAVGAYVRYMCHSSERGAPVDVIHTSLSKYSQAFLQSQNLQFWDDRKAFKKDKSRKDDDILSYCINEAKTHGLKSYRAVAQLVVDEYMARKKTLYVMHLRAKILTVWYSIGNGQTRREVIDEIIGVNNFSSISTTSCRLGLSESDMDALQDV